MKADKNDLQQKHDAFVKEQIVLAFLFKTDRGNENEAGISSYTWFYIRKPFVTEKILYWSDLWHPWNWANILFLFQLRILFQMYIYLHG